MTNNIFFTWCAPIVHLFSPIFSPTFFPICYSSNIGKNIAALVFHLCFTYVSPISHLFFTHFIFHLLLFNIEKRHFCFKAFTCFHLFFTNFHLLFTNLNVAHMLSMKRLHTHAFCFFSRMCFIYLLNSMYLAWTVMLPTLSISYWPKEHFFYCSPISHHFLWSHLCSNYFRSMLHLLFPFVFSIGLDLPKYVGNYL